MGQQVTKIKPVRVRAPRPEVLQAENLKQLEFVVHGFSTRNGGVSDAYGGESLNLGITEADTRANVQENRRIFLRAINAIKGRDTWPLVTTRQVHSAVIHHVQQVPKEPLVGDGVITDLRGVVLTVRTADCIPVLLADKKKKAVGAFHAGWRGTLARIVEKGVGEMHLKFGSQPKDISAAIGPGIHRCCYEVDESFRDKFSAQFAYSDALFEEVFDSNALHIKYPLLFLNQRAPGHGAPAMKAHLDLIEANRRQLLDAGVPEKNIWISDLCASCRTDLLFSHRAEHGYTGRMMAAIGIR
ncbi:MAG TPA: peptidoglycan editing factor PgeF [Terriglobales bacterium]|nr:peptidoglycan editing factor PgeF [Terriglobales bacterium]